MGDIPFTQYMRPSGRAVPVLFDADLQVYLMAQDLIRLGYRFETEVLWSGLVSFTCEDIPNERVISIEVVPNGEAVPTAVERLVREAHRRIFPYASPPPGTQDGD